MEVGFIPASNNNNHSTNVAPQHPLPAPPGSKIIRPPGLKRGKVEEAISDRIKLDTVLGLTVTSNAALACDPQSEVVAYPAGCTVVLYNTRKNRQHHILNASRKTITCVAFSTCGRYLATGECGHAPCVRIWDLQDHLNTVQLAEFPSHKYGVNCVSFSVNSKYLVSVGSQHDMIVNVWEWRAGLKLASNKVSSKVKAVSFAEGGGHFVTVGNRHVKFWYLEYSRGAKYKEPVPLMGRSAILGELRNNDFCDVACGRGATADSTFAITKSGLLCEFNNRRLLDKWVELRTPSANCMSLGTNLIFVGCADGIVRCFNPETLQFVTTLPRTHYLGVDVSQGLNISHMFSHPQDAKYPDAIALSYDEKNYRLTCVYNDHSLYVWDVRDIKRVGKSHSSLYHSACIWGVEVPPPPQQSPETGALMPSALPPGSFLTCSSDDTVRVWNLSSGGANAYGNIYSDELQRVLYMDTELTYLKDVDLSSVGEKDKPVSYDGKNGVRCIRVSGDGRHLASGDRAGNVRVHDLVENREVCRLEAHNAEVLCLEYCGGAAGTPGRRLLASASRDRLIHVFDVDQGYNFMQTLDDHSSSITAVRFLPSENNLQMVSCGADKTILFRSLVESPNGGSGQFQRGHNCSARGTLYDMEVDVPGRHVLAACQDRAVRVYNTRSGRHTKTFRASTGDEGSIIKVVLDRSGIYVATSCTNKSLSVYDYYSGECMATMYGHSELVTGLRFTADCQHIISASGDGCIFVWRVPHDMVVTMRARLAQQAIRQGRPVSSNGLPLDSESDRAGSPISVMHPGIPPAEDPLVLASRQDPSRVGIPQLDLHRLPPWAQKTIAGEATQNLGPTSPLKAIVRGKWAKRAENNDYKADYYMEPERPMESDGSKDSSLDSGTDTRVYVEPKQDMTDLNYKQNVSITTKTSRSNDRVRHLTDDSSLGSFKYEDHESTEHDGDIEDISDGERTSSDHNQAADRIIYYPSNNDDITPSEYTVNAMDVDELRQSQRRQRKPLLPLPLVTVSVSATSVSGSGQDSDEDEDEVSTPSGDNADRNPLSGSCESLEKMSHQMSTSLLTAFESLSGAEIDSNMEAGNTSISSQHHKTSPRTAPAIPPRNAALISATKKAMANPENTIKRIELSKRIADTKKTLEKIGYNSKLRASKSSVDLSYNTEREGDTRSTAPRARPLSQNLSASSNRAYGTEKQLSNTSPYSTNTADNKPHNYRQQAINTNTIDNNRNQEMFYDSLTNDASQLVSNKYSYKSPYDIPANINHRYNLRLEDLNCTTSEFVKKRHGHFESSHRQNEMDGNSNFNADCIPNRKIERGYAFTVDFGRSHIRSKDYSNQPRPDARKGGKVFDRLFPNANQKSEPDKRSNTVNTQNRNFTLNLNSSFDSQNPSKTATDKSGNKGLKTRSILKNYKSCPVSPVSEECKWGDTHIDIDTDGHKPDHSDIKSATYDKNLTSRKRNSLTYFMDFDTNTRQLMKDNGKSVVDTIKSDTEKMIAEITKKYGDLDDYEPSSGASDYKVDNKTFDKKFAKNIEEKKVDAKNTEAEIVVKDLIIKEDGNFSSDSLEDCSLSQDISNKNKVFSKKVCKKHHKNTPISAFARRCVSDYEIYAGINDSMNNYTEVTTVPIDTETCCHNNQQKSFTLPKNMPSNLEEFSDAYYGTQEYANNNIINNNMHRCCSALTKRCVTRSNESMLSCTDENSNCSSVSNDIFMKYGDQNAFLQKKIYEKQFIDDSQNCSIENLADAAYLEKHRHSSASFFLNQRKLMKNSASQESVLSDDLLQSDSDNQLMSKTNCNSLESILSDDSEYTKSAPLEMLFEHRRHVRRPELASGNPAGVCIPKSSQSCYEFDNTSKSYGSSPNNTSNFTTYMQHNSPYKNEGMSYAPRNLVASNYIQGGANVTRGFEIKPDDGNANKIHKNVTRSLSLQDSSTKSLSIQRKNIAYYFDGNEIKEYGETVSGSAVRNDEIPSMKSKNQEYLNNQRKSLMNCENKFKYLCAIEGMETTCINKSKSCSFDVIMEPVSSIKPIPKRLAEKSVSHVQKNLEKFENQIRKHAQSKMDKNQSNRQANNSSNKATAKTYGVTKSLERNTGLSNKNTNGKPAVDFVPHKPPKPVKRTSSVKLNNKNRLKSNADRYAGLDSGLGANVRAKIDGLQPKNSNAFMAKEMTHTESGRSITGKENKPVNEGEIGEKSFDVFVAEKGGVDNKSEIQMDSLEFIANQKKCERMSELSLDSLDNILDEKSRDNFTKDSLNYESFSDNCKFDANSTNLTANNLLKNSVSNKNMPFLKTCQKDGEVPSCSGTKVYNVGSSDDLDNKSIATEDIDMYKDIERKIDIINKLVELEERKILQEKFLKECRMRPLKANFSDGKGTVKLLSRNFEKLASKHQSKPSMDATDFFSLTYDDFDSDQEENSIKKDMKRNLSLPDVLEGENVNLVSCLEEKFVANESGNILQAESDEIPHLESNIDSKNDPAETGRDIEDCEDKVKELLNNATDSKLDTSSGLIKNKDLKQRVYNVTVIPKTDIHLDSENYESSTTSSSCANSPKRLFFGSSKPKTSRISSLFRNKFDRGKLQAYSTPKAPLKLDLNINPVPLLTKSKSVVSPTSSGGRLGASGVGPAGCRRPFPVLPPKLAMLQGWQTGTKHAIKLKLQSVLVFLKRLIIFGS